MLPPTFMPQLWALLSAVLGVLGVSYVPSPVVKATAAAAAALVVAVVQWQHHATIRHAQSVAADLGKAKVDAAAAHEADAAPLPVFDPPAPGAVPVTVPDGPAPVVSAP